MELALKPSLLSVLKLKLDEALAQVRMEEVGRGAMDQLQILRVLSTLSEDGEELETGDLVYSHCCLSYYKCQEC